MSCINGLNLPRSNARLFAPDPEIYVVDIKTYILYNIKKRANTCEQLNN